jgi:hypothetical protein
MMLSLLDRALEGTVYVLTTFPLNFMLLVAAALWFCLVLLMLIEVKVPANTRAAPKRASSKSLRHNPRGFQ